MRLMLGLLGAALLLAETRPAGAQVTLPASVQAPARGPVQAPLDLPPGAGRYDAGRFTIVAYPPEERLARTLLAEAAAHDTFPGLPTLGNQVVIALAPDDEAFRALVGAGAPEWGAAIAFPASHRIVMHGRDAGAGAGDPRVTLRHELAHLALYEVLGPTVPRWFDEGYASFAAGEWGREEVLVTSLGLVWRGVPTLAGLDSGFYLGSETAQRSYALAHRAVAELAGLDRERGLSLFFRYWQDEGSFEAALRSAFGMSSLDFETLWRSRIRRQYGAIAVAADLSVLSVFLVFLLGPLWWQRRRRQQLRMERLRAADEVVAAREREGALAALLGEDAGSPPAARPTGRAEPTK